MNILICISSKSPNSTLYACLANLYKIQIYDAHNYSIHIVDSDSDDFQYYNEIKYHFPDAEIHYIKNKNYEYGAWKYISTKYPDFDIYMCIQDSMVIQKPINLNLVDDTHAYTFHNYSGYKWHMTIKEMGIENIRTSNLDYESIVNDPDFNLAQHSSFIVNNAVIKDIFKSLTIPPVNKDGSCFYERNFGIYFTAKKIQTFDLTSSIHKTHFGRI
jgi:hypothetical protein